MSLDWNAQLVDQLDVHWNGQLRPRLDGLTDAEYIWEPVTGCWSVRPREASTAPIAAGSGDYVLEFAYPAPDPPPPTTIAWQLAYMSAGIFSVRNASHFGGPPAEYETFEYAGTAGQALGQLDEAYAAWVKGVRDLGADGLSRPCGPAEGEYADRLMAELVLHVNREVIHHGGHISQLRDLYLWKGERDGI
jgi:DinB superfamily